MKADLSATYVTSGGQSSVIMNGLLNGVFLLFVGVLLVPVFMQFDSIYRAHAAFTAAVTPPMVVALLLAVFWRRFTRPAALWTLVGHLPQ